MSSGSDVQISISVVDTNGVATVKELGSAVASMGSAGEQAGQRVATGMAQITGHARTSIDNVRLLREDLGIHMPLSMERAIAQSQVLSTAIAGIGSGLLMVGTVEIFARLAEGIYNAYEKYIDLGAVAKRYNEEALKKKDEDFINPHTIETAVMRLDQATASLTNLHNAAETMRGGFWQDVFGGLASGGLQGAVLAGGVNLAVSKNLEDQSVKARQQTDALAAKRNEDFHQLALQQINEKHAGDGRLKGEAAITAELQKQLAIHKENQAFAQDMESIRGTGATKAGALARSSEDAIAQAEATTKRIELARKETDEIERMRAEASQAGREGNALYAAQEQNAIAAVTLKFHEGEISKKEWASKTASIQQEFAADAAKRQDDLDARVRKAQVDAAAAGLTGIARIQAEAQAALAAIDKEERKATGGAPETEAQRRDFSALRSTEQGSGAQKQLEAPRQYYEQMNQMMEGFTAQSQEGYGRIYADADKSAQNVWKSWQTTWGQLDAMDAGWVESVNKAARLVAQIYTNADREAARLHQQTMDSLKKEEEEAARAILPPWQAAEIAIEATYQERVQHAREALAAQKIDQTEFNQEMVTAGAAATAQMTRQMQDTRDKLAGTLQSFTKNPTQFIESRAMDTAFQYMSNEMMQLFQNHSGNPGVGMLGWLFGMNGSPSTSTNPATFGRSLFGMGGGGTNAGVPGFDQLSSGATTLQTGAVTLQTASQTLGQVAQQMLATGGVGNAGSDMMMPGFGGISAGSGGATSGAASAALGGFGSAGASGGFSSADIASLTPETGPNAAGGGFSAIGGGAAENAATTAGTSASPWLGAAGAAITGAEGLYSAYQTSSPLAGAVSGAMSGAAIGTAFAPGVGTAIGAVVGGIAGILAGLFGDKGKGQAQDLDNKTVQPGIANELQQFNNNTTGYTQASQYLDQLQVQAMNQTNALGSGARAWYSGHILPEIQAAQAIIAREEKGNRSLVALSAAQYHSGGLVGDFGDLALNASEGYILAQRGEMVVNAAAASAHAPTLHAMNSGAISPGALRGSQMVPANAAAGGQPIYITAWDARSVQDWLRSGGATQLRQGANMAIGQYGGNGVR